jgi:hypothetical protein
MAVHMDKSWWRKSLAIGILPFAALGIAGCEEEPVEDEAVVEEEPAEEEPLEEEPLEEEPVEE